MLLQQQLEKIMRKKKFSKLVSSCQYYCLLGTVHTTSSAGGFDCRCIFAAYIAIKIIGDGREIQVRDCRNCQMPYRDNVPVNDNSLCHYVPLLLMMPP